MNTKTLRELIQKAHNGSSITSVNMISGNMFKTPDFTLNPADINETDGTVILKSPGCRAEGRGSREATLVIEHIESITYFS